MMTVKNMLMLGLMLFALASFGCASGGYYYPGSTGHYDTPGGYGYYEYNYPSPYRDYRGYRHRDDRHDFRGGGHERHRGGDNERGHGDRHDREYEKD